MPPENLKQADLPRGAVPIEPEGTAPGFYVEAGRSLVVALPGVPWEMRAMLDKTVIPLLSARGDGAAIVSRQVLVVGLGESATHGLIADLVAAQSNPTIAYLAGGGQVRVRLTAKAASEADADALIRPVEREVRARLGDAAVEGSGDSVAAALGVLLRARSATVAAAESLTGGLVGAALSDAPGSSDFFAGSLVCYATAAKAEVAGVDRAILDGPGAVSPEAARALAEAAARAFGTDLGVSTTGVAGPAEQEGRPPGTIYVGATWRGRTEARLVRAYGDREHVRAFAVTAAIDLGRRALSWE
jgi:nicotinamide-nucleotide amidase